MSHRVDGGQRRGVLVGPETAHGPRKGIRISCSKLTFEFCNSASSTVRISSKHEHCKGCVISEQALLPQAIKPGEVRAGKS